jgi:hypothetical protein
VPRDRASGAGRVPGRSAARHGQHAVERGWDDGLGGHLRRYLRRNRGDFGVPHRDRQRGVARVVGGLPGRRRSDRHHHDHHAGRRRARRAGWVHGPGRRGDPRHADPAQRSRAHGRRGAWSSRAGRSRAPTTSTSCFRAS